MHTEPGIRGRLILRLLGFVLLGALFSETSWAGPWFGHLQVQYQSVNRDVVIIRGDGSTSSQTLKRSWWMQNYELNFSNQFKNRLQLLAQARFTDVSVNNRTEGQTIPEGSLRLNHPYYGFTGRYRPITTTATANTPDFGVGGGDGTGSLFEFKVTNTELTLTGFAAPPRLPRLDLSWIQRTQTSSTTDIKDTGITRNARLTYAVGRLALRADAGNWSSSSSQISGTRVIQTNYGLGGAFAILQNAGQALDVRYDLQQTNRLPETASKATTTSHTAGITGFQKFSQAVTGNLQYNFRQTDITNGVGRTVSQQNGSIQVQYVPRPALRFSAGTGVRTLPRGLTQVAQEYLNATAAAQGRVLPGWEGQASFSHVTNWTPGEPNYSIENLRFGSLFVLAQGLEVFGDATGTNNGNPVTQFVGKVIQANAGIRARPRQSISLEYRYGIYRAGPSFTSVLARSREWKFTFTWRLVEPLEFATDFSRAGARPDNDPDLRTLSARLKWTPSQLVQLTALYSKSDRIFLDPTADFLVGTEIASIRWVSGVGRSWVFGANFSVSNPGDPLEARQVDATVTYSFGR